MTIDMNLVEDFPIWMKSVPANHSAVLIAMKSVEAFNRPAITEIEFISDDDSINLNDFVGQPMELVARVPAGPERLESGMRERSFKGTCVEARFLSVNGGVAHYAAEIRPKLWFLSLSRDCRIYQNMTAADIIKEILGDYGITYDDKLSDTYPERIICVQYRETDLDFLHRLMEEEGICYYLDHEANTEKLVLVDDSGSQGPVSGTSEIAFMQLAVGNRRDFEHLYDWRRDTSATTGKVTLSDFNFETPRANLESVKAVPKGNHDLKDMEIYDTPGHYSAAGGGERYARIQMEERSVRHETWIGTGLVSNLEVGGTFSVKDHPRTQEGDDLLAIETTHYFRLNDEDLNRVGTEVSLDLLPRTTGGGDSDPYQVVVRAIPSQEKYRPAPVTPWPEIAGIHTAIVTGPEGEEIHTDKYGRVRIQFHWDRFGGSDDKSTCWVRCMMPWTGKGWGAIAIPRIGQEVVVQFEEGDPDRPLVIGMLYNADTMPPYALPANQTQSGIKSNSSKGGQGFNEMRFEDLKDKEEVYFQAERDYKQVVKNNAHITVGFEKTAKGNLKHEVYEDREEEVGNDYKLKIGHGRKKKGDMALDVYNDRTEEVGHHDTLKVGFGSNGPGNQTLKVNNNRTETIGQNHATTVQKGNYKLDVSLGKIAMTAMQEIKLTCGGSTIKMTPQEVSIVSPMVKIEGQMQFEAKGGIMSKVSGGAMLVLQGGLVKIN